MGVKKRKHNKNCLPATDRMQLFVPAIVVVAVLATMCGTSAQYNVGAGIYDITGPAAEIGMMVTK